MIASRSWAICASRSWADIGTIMVFFKGASSWCLRCEITAPPVSRICTRPTHPQGDESLASAGRGGGLPVGNPGPWQARDRRGARCQRRRQAARRVRRSKPARGTARLSPCSPCTIGSRTRPRDAMAARTARRAPCRPPAAPSCVPRASRSWEQATGCASICPAAGARRPARTADRSDRDGYCPGLCHCRSGACPVRRQGGRGQGSVAPSRNTSVSTPRR